MCLAETNKSNKAIAGLLSLLLFVIVLIPIIILIFRTENDNYQQKEKTKLILFSNGITLSPGDGLDIFPYSNDNQRTRVFNLGNNYLSYTDASMDPKENILKLLPGETVILPYDIYLHDNYNFKYKLKITSLTDDQIKLSLIEREE